MKTKEHYFLKAKSLFIATSSFLLLISCSEDTNFEEIEQVNNLDIKNESVANKTTFNFTPYVVRLVEDVANMNVTNKRAIVDVALSLSNNNIDFAAYALSIAMQETRILTGNTGPAGSNSEYPWRDSKLESNSYSGPAKDGDSSNFGIYKMNWYMIRHSNTMKANNGGNVIGNYAYGNYGDSNGWGQKINTSITLSTKILYDYWNTMQSRPNGTSADGNSSEDSNAGIARNFWGGHRYGQTGWNDGNYDFFGGTRGVNYKGWQNTIDYWYAIYRLKNEIDGQIQGFKTTNRRLAYNIPNLKK
jgi:hypothetical protein